MKKRFGIYVQGYGYYRFSLVTLRSTEICTEIQRGKLAPFMIDSGEYNNLILAFTIVDHPGLTTVC